jgi:hypothetical protein
VLTGFTARGGDRGGDDDGDVLLPTPTLEPRAGDTAAADALGTTLVLLLLLLLLHASNCACTCASRCLSIERLLSSSVEEADFPRVSRPAAPTAASTAAPTFAPTAEPVPTAASTAASNAAPTAEIAPDEEVPSPACKVQHIAQRQSSRVQLTDECTQHPKCWPGAVFAHPRNVGEVKLPRLVDI